MVTLPHNSADYSLMGISYSFCVIILTRKCQLVNTFDKK